MTLATQKTTETVEVPIRASDSLTSDQPVRPTAARIYARRIREADRTRAYMFDDLVISLQIANRDRADSGERLDVDDFLRAEGFEPDALGG
jgi:hypothetical protein